MKKTPKLFLLLIISLIVMLLPLTGHASSDINKLSPVVRITSYKVIKGSIEPGKSFEIEFKVENSNVNSNAYNILIGYTVRIDDTFYIDMGETNQVYIDELKGGETTSFIAKLNVFDYTQRPVSVLAFHYYYENENGIIFENTTDISPEIKINPLTSKLDINSLSVTNNAYYDSDTLITTMYSNIGETNLKNIKLTIIGNIVNGKKTFDLGSLNEGEHNVNSEYINFTDLGNQMLTYSFTYDDEYGTSYLIEEKEINVKVSEKINENNKINKSNNIFDKIFNTSTTTFKIVLILVIGIFLIGILTNILLHLKMKKR